MQSYSATHTYHSQRNYFHICLGSNRITKRRRERSSRCSPSLVVAHATPGGGDVLDAYSDIRGPLTFSEVPPGHKSGFITILGRPNAGKSTLMNAILQQALSIVTAKAQTTRHRIMGILSEPTFQAIFLDTPGIMDDTKNKLDDRMMASVRESMKDADAILALVDASARNPKGTLAMIRPGDNWVGPPMAILLNKVDKLAEEQVEDIVTWYQENAGVAAVFPVSALEGMGLESVLEWVENVLPEGPSLYPKDFISEAPERFFVSEILRKNVFLQYREEIPYSVAVEIVEFKERKGGAKDFIAAHILVEHARQRGIIIGKGGQALKQLSSESRKEIESFLGREVYLDVSIKVAEGWRTDAARLEQLGY